MLLDGKWCHEMEQDTDKVLISGKSSEQECMQGRRKTKQEILQEEEK